MATHSSVLAWRTPGTGEPGGLPSLGSHRVGHDWNDLAAAAAAIREMQIKISVGYHFISIRMAIIKNINNNKNNKHLWIYGENCNLCIVVGTYNQATSVENSVMSPQKTKCRFTKWSRNSTFRYKLKRTDSRVFFPLTEIELIYNAAIVSGVQQGDSVLYVFQSTFKYIYIYTHTHTHIQT